MNHSTNQPGLYRRIWRWHFFAGLLVAPFAVVLAITGAIYLFAPQLNAFSEARLHTIDSVDDVTERRSPQQVLDRLLSENPDYRFHRVRLARVGDQSYEIDLKATKPTTKPTMMRYWVHALSGQLLATKNPDTLVPEFVKRVHGELLSGKFGSLIVELMACWFIVLLLTGLYLYWPRGSSWQSVLFPSLRKRGRALLLTLHGSIAVWASLVILVFLLSGLPWTQVWGGGFNWVQDKLGLPNQGQEWRVTLQSNAKPDGKMVGIGLNGAMNLANDALLMPPVFVVPPKQDGVWTVRSLHPNRANRVTIHFDQWTGEQLLRIEFSQKHIFKRVVSHAISLHEGHLFGPLNQALGVVVALCVIVISVTGPLMWWRRRPPGKLAVPSPPSNYKVSINVRLLVFLIAALLPLVAISILVLLALEIFACRLKNVLSA